MSNSMNRIGAWMRKLSGPPNADFSRDNHEPWGQGVSKRSLSVRYDGVCLCRDAWGYDGPAAFRMLLRVGDAGGGAEGAAPGNHRNDVGDFPVSVAGRD